MRSSWCPGDEPERRDPELGLRTCIRLLRHDGWPIAKIADYLGTDLSTVRRVLDRRAQELHDQWAR